jgi:2-methylisocitrate lyase-like PEP mutase family enzyme
VSADLLDGYGLHAVELVDRMLAAGVVGCNLEDSDHARPGSLLEPGMAAERIAQVRSAATAAGVEIVINARIDTYLFADQQPGSDSTSDVVTRARQYLGAGADCVYPVRLTDPHAVHELVEQLDAAVNANMAGNSMVTELAGAGASRISIGPSAFRATLATLDRLAAELFGSTGTTT